MTIITGRTLKDNTPIKSKGLSCLKDKETNVCSKSTASLNVYDQAIYRHLSHACLLPCVTSSNHVTTPLQKPAKNTPQSPIEILNRPNTASSWAQSSTASIDRQVNFYLAVVDYSIAQLALTWGIKRHLFIDAIVNSLISLIFVCLKWATEKVLFLLVVGHAWIEHFEDVSIGFSNRFSWFFEEADWCFLLRLFDHAESDFHVF